MNSLTFDAHKAVKAITEAGATESLAEAVVATVSAAATAVGKYAATKDMKAQPMNSLAFDTHKAVKALTQAGATEPLAEAVVAIVVGAALDKHAANTR